MNGIIRLPDAMEKPMRVIPIRTGHGTMVIIMVELRIRIFDYVIEYHIGELLS